MVLTCSLALAAAADEDNGKAVAAEVVDRTEMTQAKVEDGIDLLGGDRSTAPSGVVAVIIATTIGEWTSDTEGLTYLPFSTCFQLLNLSDLHWV